MKKSVIVTDRKQISRRDSGHADLYLNAYRALPLEWVQVVKSGVEPSLLDQIAGNMKVTQEKLLEILGVPRATFHRFSSKKLRMPLELSSRVYGITRLIGQVQAMVDESGGQEGFDAAQWVAKWLEEPSPALGGRKPSGYMDSAEGQQLVSRLLSQAQSGAYA